MRIISPIKDKWLGFFLNIVIALRFFYPFHRNPLDFLFTDPGAHWRSAESLFLPSFLRGYMPSGYQFYLYFIRSITSDSRFGIAFCTGILCALLPWLWYRICKKFIPQERLALLCAICIGLMPSLFFNYAFFMDESLMLDVTAAAILLSLHYLDKRAGALFLWQTIMWTFAMLTKLPVIPVAILFWTYSLFKVRPPLQTLVSAILISALMITCAGFKNAISTHFFSPFGIPQMNAIYVNSTASTLHIKYDNNQNYNYESPSILSNPLEPFGHWQSARQGDETITIHSDQGRKDWDRELSALPFHFASYINQVRDNIIYFFFAPSWTETTIKGFEGSLIRFSRWIWFPLMLFIITGLVAQPWNYDTRTGHFLFITLFMVVAMLLQNSAIMEGRYRKLLEPMLITSGFIIYTSRNRRRLSQPTAYDV